MRVYQLRNGNLVLVRLTDRDEASAAGLSDKESQDIKWLEVLESSIAAIRRTRCGSVLPSQRVTSWRRSTAEMYRSEVLQLSIDAARELGYCSAT